MVRAHSAVKADDLDVKFIEPAGKILWRRTKDGLAVHLDRHLGDDRQARYFAYGTHRLLDGLNLGKCFKHEKVDSALKKALDLLNRSEGDALMELRRCFRWKQGRARVKVTPTAHIEP